MAAFGDLLQRIARSLEEAQAQRPTDDLRARLGYGTGDDDEDELASETVWEPEAERRSETVRGTATVRRPDTANATGAPRTGGSPWVKEPLRAYPPPSSRVPATHPAPPHDRAAHGRHSAAGPPHRHASTASLISERLRARLRTVDALREAFVLKEILDRPLGRRHGR